MKILTSWLRHYLPALPVSDRQLADDLTLRGIAVEGVHELGAVSGEDAGHLFEMDITTNRVDAMNHYGIAREAATIYDLPLEPLDAKLPARTPVETPFPVRIEAEAKGLCGRFTAQVIRGVTIGPSSGQVAEYFELLGQKQISNAVDASNFVLLAMGHPTHAFDLDKIEGGLVVRFARKGERLKLLDGSERTLEVDDLVVADEKKALALAGVMGGWDSMITPETKNILIEAAWFDPASIRRSSRRHGLHTDASHRFERGADFNGAPVANALVAQLVLQSGGTVEGEMVDLIDAEVQARTALRTPLELSVKEVQRHLGTTVEDKAGSSALTADLIRQYLTALGCTLTEASGTTGVKKTGLVNWASEKTAPQVAAGDAASTATGFQVQLPSWRLDLEREIDLIEEVARVYGYNRFANTLPVPGIVIAHPTAEKAAAVRERLLALGFSESISSTFSSRQESELFYAGEEKTVPMENPLSEEASLLRPSLVPGMVTMLGHNLNRDVREVRLFEQGQVFSGTTPADGNYISEVREAAELSLGLTSANPQATALHSANDALFFEVKGAVESVLSLFAATGVSFSAEAPGWLEQGRCATVVLDGQPLGWFGELARTQREARKFRQPVYLAQLDLGRLYELPLKKVTARELSRFQAVERDFSFTFPDTTPWERVAEAICSLQIPELQRLSPSEIFRDPKGKSVPPSHYALLLKCVFQSKERTLREEELTSWWSSIIDTLTRLGGTIRAPGGTT
jgi:phenylalanyl-tRNA synthetase beta chain